MDIVGLREEPETGSECFGNPHSAKQAGTIAMAKESTSAAKDVKAAMHKRKAGTLKSGGSGRTVKSKKQAIAIGLSEARAKGKKVPPRKKAS